MYAVFAHDFGIEIPRAQASKMIDDIYWGEWLTNNPYASMIETTTGADTQGIAALSWIDPADAQAKSYHMKIWFPIRRKS